MGTTIPLVRSNATRASNRCVATLDRRDDDIFSGIFGPGGDTVLFSASWLREEPKPSDWKF